MIYFLYETGCLYYFYIDKEFLKLKEGMAELSQYYIIVRYPLEHYPAGKNDAQSAIGFAEEIRQFIYAKII